MEAAPPSYEKATLVDPWDIIARYIPSNDLCSAALVCDRWHATFTPHLWGNPASHFGTENDRVYVALTRFKRTLQTARLLVRALTHTIHLPPAHAELYNGPHAHWLRDILDRLPNLQSLIVRELPFFDHSALQALKYTKPKTEESHGRSLGAVELPASVGYQFQQPVDFVPSFGLRLLDASRCSNVTSTSLAQALGRLESLIYLDLSFTYAARDPIVLKALRRFLGLQVLKLRGVSLSDEAVQVLAPAIRRRVRSLDLRNNNITDRGVRTLLEECFLTSGENGSASDAAQRSPALLPYIGREMLDIYQGEDFESFLRSAFTRRFVGRLAIEDAPEGGITHLYIAGNQISVEGVSSLLKPGRLHVLDAHSVASLLGRQAYNYLAVNADVEMGMPGVENLTPLMAKYVSNSMTFLRIGHTIVTKDAPDMHTDEVVQGRVELANTALPELPRDAVELAATPFSPEIFELPAVHTPRYELPGDPMQFVVSPATNDRQHMLNEREGFPFNGPRRGSAFAPEVVDSLSAETGQTRLISPVSAYDGGGTFDGFSSITPITPAGAENPAIPDMEPGASTRPRTYSSVVVERKVRLDAHNAGKHGLHPAMLPRLETLVLTDVPPSSSSQDIANRLVCFIKQCAEESSLAKASAKLDYALPPGRKGHASALKQSADRIFALKRLVLEMAPDLSARRSSRASQWHYLNTKSVTEDRDSETLWSAAETDFSFFGDDDYSFPSLDSGRFAQSTPEKEVSFSNGFVAQNPSPLLQTPQQQERYDTIALLTAFRKGRKIAHDRNLAAGAVDPDTEGYWEGVVQVIRPGSSPLRGDEAVDYHSKRFENSNMYR